MKQNKLFLLTFLFLSLIFFSCQTKNSNTAEKSIQSIQIIDSLVFKIKVDDNSIIRLEGEIVEVENIADKIDSLLSLYPEQIQKTLRVAITGSVNLDMEIVRNIRDELRKSKSATKYLNKSI